MKHRGCSSFDAGEGGEELSSMSHISAHKSPCPPHCQLCYSTFLGNFRHSWTEVLGHIHQPITCRAGERQSCKLVKYVKDEERTKTSYILIEVVISSRVTNEKDTNALQHVSNRSGCC